MGKSLHNRVESLIYDTNSAFQAYGSVNTDYAEFASMAISEFKDALGHPHLRRKELAALLRKSMVKSRCDDPDQWTILMAAQLKRAANKRAQQRSV